MNKNEQIRFVNELMDSLQDRIVKAIQDGKVPEDWDGVELRWLIKDTAHLCVWSTTDKSRKAKYNNHCLIENLP